MSQESNLTDRLRDLARQAADHGFLTHTGFLTPAEQTEAAIWLKKNRIAAAMHGGFAGAERQVYFLLPEYQAGSVLADEDIAETISALDLKLPPRITVAAPGHRDYLGSLLGLGIRRDQLGDILVREDGATIVMLAGMTAFIENHLERVGAVPIRVAPLALSAISVSPSQTTTLRLTVASRRLDKIAACGFGISRTDMADMIRSGSVQVNWREEPRPDYEVPIGAVISLRGHGRIRLLQTEGLSRKSREILMIERYG